MTDEMKQRLHRLVDEASDTKRPAAERADLLEELLDLAYFARHRFERGEETLKRYPTSIRGSN